MLIPNGLLESHIEAMWIGWSHISTRTPPKLGRTQGCGFWANTSQEIHNLYNPSICTHTFVWKGNLSLLG